MIAVPSDDVLSYKAGYSGADVGMVSTYIAPFANDANSPAFVLPATDGDNAWGGGNSSWNESTPQFFSGCDSAGYTPTTIQDFVNQYGANASDAHIEDGAWIFPEMCYGSPYFLKWVDPPTNPKNLASCYPNTQIDLVTRASPQVLGLGARHRAPTGAKTAEQILETKRHAPTGSPSPTGGSLPRLDGTYTTPTKSNALAHLPCGPRFRLHHYGGRNDDDEGSKSPSPTAARFEMLSPE
jgi:hypothetical protein